MQLLFEICTIGDDHERAFYHSFLPTGTVVQKKVSENQRKATGKLRGAKPKKAKGFRKKTILKEEK